MCLTDPPLRPILSFEGFPAGPRGKGHVGVEGAELSRMATLPLSVTELALGVDKLPKGEKGGAKPSLPW